MMIEKKKALADLLKYLAGEEIPEVEGQEAEVSEDAMKPNIEEMVKGKQEESPEACEECSDESMVCPKCGEAMSCDCAPDQPEYQMKQPAHLKLGNVGLANKKPVVAVSIKEVIASAKPMLKKGK